MGNVISKSDSICLGLYESYYPKQSWLHPVFVASAGMLGLLGSVAYSKRVVLATPRLNSQYLYSLATCFGSQVWHLFVSKPVLLRLLPRHQFGHVESYLKPKFLFISTLFTGLNAYTFLQRFPLSTWNEDIFYTGSLVLGAFALSFLNSTIFGMQSIKYMTRLHQIERDYKVGVTDVGYEKLTQNTELSNDPEYADVLNSFEITNAFSFILDLATFVANGAQIYLLANRGIFNI